LGQHWSFEPIQEVAIPEPDLANWPQWQTNPIDRFVLKKLQERERSPSVPASKEALLRRVTLDLTGLPPTIEEIDAFLADDSETAYESVVDRLLASPHYGERMAWNWLDAARYADSNGYQGDRERTMWPWRDWVIRAFNENLPFDQFTVWQVAGDQLPEPTFEQKLATGFFRNHMINGEGGRIAEENRIEYVFDMTETMGTVWLGLTLNCCRCHDHKFDPLSRKNYYELFAFFNQTPVNGGGGDPQTPPVIAAPTDDQADQIAKLEHELRETRLAIEARRQELGEEQSAWEKDRLRQLSETATWSILKPTEMVADHQDLSLLEDGSVFVSGENPANDTYHLTLPLSKGKVTAIRLEAIRHESMTNGGLARSDSGNFVLTEIDLSLNQAGSEVAVPVKVATAEATFEQGNYTVEKTFDGNPKTGWAVYQGKPIDRNHEAIFRLAEPIEVTDEATLRVSLHHDSPHTHHNLGRFRMSVTAVPDPKLGDGQDALLSALRTSAEKRDQAQQKLIREEFLKADKTYQQLVAARERAEKQLQSTRNGLAKVMVLQDQPNPRETFMLTKGLYNKLEDKVTAATPESLPPLPEGSSSNRLGLANWLVANDNPLTARVTVNRFWQQFFGVGLVKTPGDFGVQGEVPVHLELLNWLAWHFRETGWDVKGLVRLIVTSEAYKQTSKSSPEAIEQDPENRFVGRGPRYRMPSWMIRDQALAISGLLVPKVGGPPVNGYQPPGIWEEATFGKKSYKQDSGDALYRRSLYTFWRRIVAPTMFFDTASRQTCTVQPIRTNTPLHALVTLNDITFVEAARKMAERVLKHSSEDGQRMEYAFRLATSRRPQAKEQTILLQRLDKLKTKYADEETGRQELLSVGESPRDESLDAVQLAAWTGVCTVLLNLDETLSKQ
ncbi:MAG: DUF1549 domain-containing protein, partial [Planctomycetaceae bacterium]|nr:DUF1549 domain-containing protein [Planctomycetaceae bacterium]